MWPTLLSYWSYFSPNKEHNIRTKLKEKEFCVVKSLWRKYMTEIEGSKRRGRPVERWKGGVKELLIDGELSRRKCMDMERWRERDINFSNLNFNGRWITIRGCNSRTKWDYITSYTLFYNYKESCTVHTHQDKQHINVLTISPYLFILSL